MSVDSQKAGQRVMRSLVRLFDCLRLRINPAKSAVDRGLSLTAAAKVAVHARRWWWNSAMAINIALPNSYFRARGVPNPAP